MMKQSDPEYLGYYPEAELVLAIVCPLGTPYGRVVETLGNYLGQFGYKNSPIKISEYFDDLLRRLGSELRPEGEGAAKIARHKIAAGNEIRRLTQKNDVMALAAASVIAQLREGANRGSGLKPNQRLNLPLNKTAFVISTVSRPEEVTTLRRIYGEAFFLVGVNASREVRKRYLAQRGIFEPDATDLMETDAKENSEHGQATRDAFQMADVLYRIRARAMIVRTR